MNTRSLLRATVSEGMDIFTIKKAGKWVKLILSGVIFLLFFGWATAAIFMLRALGQEIAILSMFVAITSLLTIIEGIYKAGSLLFDCRDDDMLLALPISRQKIVALRIFKFYVFELAFNALFLTPAMLAYGLFANPGFWFWPLSILMILFLPIIPVAISAVLGAVITSLSSRFKKHNLIQTLLSFVVMMITMAASFFSSSFTENIGNYAGGIAEVVNRIYYPARIYTQLVQSFSVLELLLFLLIHAAAMGAAVAFISAIYFRINSRVKTVTTTVKESETLALTKTNKPFVALVKKELKRFFSTPVFVTNAGFGLILFLVGAVLVCWKFNDLGSVLNDAEAPVTIESLQGYVPFLAFSMMAFCSLMTFLTSAMVSLEGRAINLMKTLPVSVQKILLAKVGASLVIVWPPIILGILVMVFWFKFGILESLLLVVAGIVLPIIVELFGIITDLKHAKLDAENDAEVVKQSTSVLISTFFGLGGSVAIIGVTAAITFTIGQVTALAVIDLAMIVGLAILYSYFAKTCEKRFMKLEA